MPAERVGAARQLPHQRQHIVAEVLAKRGARVRNVVQVGVVALAAGVAGHVQAGHAPHLVEHAPVRLGGHQLRLKDVH